MDTTTTAADKKRVRLRVVSCAGLIIPVAQYEISIFDICRGNIQPIEEAVSLPLCLLLPLPRKPCASLASKLALDVLPCLLSAADETGDELQVEAEARQLTLCVLCAPARV